MTIRAKVFMALVAVALATGLGLYGFRRNVFRPAPGAGVTTMNGPAATTTSPQTRETPRGPVDIDPRRQQLVGVRTVTATRQSFSQTIRAVGIVRYDETRQADVNVKVEGWIRDLFVNYTGQPIRRGQPLFTLYSPQVLAAENEYLLALKSRDQMQQSQIADARLRADQLVSAALQRLQLWDLSREDLAALDRDRQAGTAITVRAPVDGFVVDKQAIAGMHVMPGQTLYKVADISMVWVEANVYESEMPLIRLGQSATVTVDAFPGDQYIGRVTYIYPYVDEQTRTNKVRCAFANASGHLKPGMYANVNLEPGEGDGIVVPSNAVLDSGREQVVFVAEGDGRFAPRHVKIGRRSEGQIEIREGLREGEQVAAAAAFFLDSESQLRGSLESYTSNSQPGSTTAVPEQQLSITLRTAPDPPKVGENQFEVSVRDQGGKPVDGADVSVEFFMAAMPVMNMPAMRNDIKLSPAGAGMYKGAGQVLMGGRWEVTVNVARGGQRLGSRRLPVVTQ